MEAIFLKLVNMSITASYLVLAVLILRLIFKNAPKSIRVILWGIVALRLITPFSIKSAMSLIPSVEPLPQEFLYAATPQIESGIPEVNAAINPMIEQSLSPQIGASANPTQIWSFIFSQVWILGMVLMLGYALVSYLLLRRKVAASISLDKNLRLCDHIASPFILGIFRPVIYLPSELDPATADMVLAHEYAHIKRKDHWWKPLGFALLCVYWFNPVMWLAYILLCRDIELACDERVIREMGEDTKKSYSEALLRCSVSRNMIAACPLAFGEVGVKDRIKSVLRYKKPAFWVIAVAVILCIIVAVCFLTDPMKKVDPLTLDDWGITITAHDPSPTGVILAYHIPDNLDGEITIPMNQTLLKADGDTWTEVPALVFHDRYNWAKWLSADQDETRQYLDWSVIYGTLPPGQYSIRKTLWLHQDGLGYQKDFYADFSIPMKERVAEGIYTPSECLYMNPLSSYFPVEGDIPFTVEIHSGCNILSPSGEPIEENPNVIWGWRHLKESGEDVSFLLYWLNYNSTLELPKNTLYQKLSDGYHLLLLDGQDLLLLQGQRGMRVEGQIRDRQAEGLWSIYRLEPENTTNDNEIMPSMENVIASLRKKDSILQIDLSYGGDLILGSYSGWDTRNDTQYAGSLENYSYTPIEEQDFPVNQTMITLKFGHIGKICYLTFADNSNLIKLYYDGTAQYFEAVSKYGDALTVGEIMRKWYDTAEYEALGDAIAPIEAETNYLRAVELFCETYFGAHTKVSSDSMFRYSFVKCDVEVDMEATNLARARGELDENGYAFWVTVTFLPGNDRGAAEYMAGNTHDYTGSDPDIPAGALQNHWCGYLSLTEDGWVGQILGSSF